MLPVAIREARPQDETAVIALWRACNLVVSTNDPAEDFRFACSGSNSNVLLAEDDEGAIVGSVMVGHDGHRGWLYYVAADPARQAQGIGQRLVAAGEDWLRAHGVAKVQLLVRETNANVVSFYEYLGFEVAPRIVLSKWLRDKD